VSDLCQKLQERNEKDELVRTELSRELHAKVTTHDKTLSDLTEAKLKVAHLESQLKISQEAQEKMASGSQSGLQNAKSNKDSARESSSLRYMISSLF